MHTVKVYRDGWVVDRFVGHPAIAMLFAIRRYDPFQ